MRIVQKKHKLRLRGRWEKTVTGKKVWNGLNKASVPPRAFPPGQQRKPKNNNFDVTGEVIDKIERLSAQGMNREQICYALDISPDTLYKRCKKDPVIESAVSDAIKKGRSKGIALVTNRLFEDAKQPGRLGAQAFFLKNTAGFKDHASTEITGAGGEPLIPRREYSDEERAIKIASILAAARKRRTGKLTITKKR